MSFGLSATGFSRKRLEDIKTELETALKLVFGDNIDLSPQSVFGQIIGIFSERLAIGWERSEDVYNSQYPSTAVGNQLSNVVQYNDITRQDGTFSTGTVSLDGVGGTIIPAGSIVSVENTGERFVTDAEVTLTGSPEDVTVTAESVGPFTAIAGTLNVIETPIFGWEFVTNALDITPGRAEETDAELRIRRELSTGASGQNLVDSLFGQLLNIDDVTAAVVIDNKTDSTDANGIPAHQFSSIVLGGLDADVADAIWKNTPQGIDSFGSTTVTIVDDQGFNQPVNFTRPSDVDIYFKIDITTGDEFPANGDVTIKESVATYGQANFSIGDDVILSEFYTAINETPGVLSIDLRIGLAASPSGTVNIPIIIEEISRYSTTRIEVNIV